MRPGSPLREANASRTRFKQVFESDLAPDASMLACMMGSSREAGCASGDSHGPRLVRSELAARCRNEHAAAQAREFSLGNTAASMSWLLHW